MPAPINPNDFPHRSPIYRIHQGLGANFTALDDQRAVVADYGDAGVEKAAVAQLALADLTLLARGGFKGKGCSEFVQQAGTYFPGFNNTALLMSKGGLIARLSNAEVMTVAPHIKAEADISALRDVWQARRDAGDQHIAYLAPRDLTHGCFSLSGEHAATMMAKICAVDLRDHVFGNLDVAQTLAACTSMVVIRCDIGKTLRLLLLFDIAQTEYFWGIIIDAMGEFSGKPVGTNAVI
ncbi:MAG: hypothetical protein HRT36_00610 [Alphaproteobacteria bacterium]|nr:hypothetical protein [Alphaproteobacteria bacterium]